MANAFTALVDAIAGGGYLKIYKGSIPLITDSESVSDLLATVAFDATDAFGDAASGTAAAAPMDSVTVDQTGTATYYRITNNSGTVIAQGTCGGTGSGEGLVFDDPALVEDGTLTITSYAVTMPSGA